MAKTVNKNPTYFSGPVLQEIRSIRAADSKTWKAGELYTLDSNGLVDVVATGGVDIKGFFAEDQDTSTSSTDVAVYKIPSSSTKFIGFISAGDADVVADNANRGDRLGVHVGANRVTIDENETSNVAVRVDDILSNIETSNSDVTDDPGQVIFSFLQTVLEA